ncbi:hypothetical protein L249_2042 [Ophiocordyceps polyrhachis-furcata BCC 54312]|uniref:Heme oxygenase-like protein n=1 Tax=Ophiocordyceps polyrhachis-furcata BCC 54312 TaxID=1330021 RepID=A0A367LSZ6_9HYPO|nr:hypothetical protein L249_2042 [Ophiocordyceps polyrhachis-furcata BCC 54312]
MSTDLEALLERGLPLAQTLNLATRDVHARINTLVSSRLKLALPPRAADASLYLMGILHVAPIYATVETLWRDASRDVTSPIGPLLECLRLPGLMRSQSLRRDVAALSGWDADKVEERIRMAASGPGHVAEWVAHMRRVVEDRPHILVAYAHVLFMALFAGGRFINGRLKAAGNAFWWSLRGDSHHHHHHHFSPQHHRQSSETDPLDEAAPLRFFHFDGPDNGNDLKHEFKRLLAESEGIFTHGEKMDILEEGICIFEHVGLLVAQLDSVCASLKTKPQREAFSTSSSSSSSSSATTSATARSSPAIISDFFREAIGSRIRDSIAVTRQRWDHDYRQRLPRRCDGRLKAVHFDEAKTPPPTTTTPAAVFSHSSGSWLMFFATAAALLFTALLAGRWTSGHWLRD